MNNGYGGGYNTGGIPGCDPMSATSSENDAMPGTGAGKTTSLLERLSIGIARSKPHAELIDIVEALEPSRASVDEVIGPSPHQR